jgi:hypothetical protein
MPTTPSLLKFLLKFVSHGKLFHLDNFNFVLIEKNSRLMFLGQAFN